MKTQNKFFQNVNLRSRKAMTEFLVNHFRYDTMNSWNRSTSYANDMKIHHVIPSEFRDKVYEMMDAENFYDDLNWLLSDFDMEHDHKYQVGFNGRSGGYLVLYEGQKTVEPYLNAKEVDEVKQGKSVYVADGIGWRSGKEAEAYIGKNKTTISSFPGRSIDQDEDFTEWSIDSLKERVKLVQSFDKLCDDIVNQTIAMAKNYNVEEEEYTVTKTRKVLA